MKPRSAEQKSSSLRDENTLGIKGLEIGLYLFDWLSSSGTANLNDLTRPLFVAP